jgi:prepilin-type N-terminal cleavage/methylation domain-containing protein
MKRERGFSLIELMVVVAIVAILSGLMMGLASRTDSANAKVISERLVSDLQFARARAIATRKVHQVYITTSGGEQFVTIYAATTKGMSSSQTYDTKPVQVTRLPKTTIIWSTDTVAKTTTGATPTKGTNVPRQIFFRPDGSADAATIYVTDSMGTPRYFRVLVYQRTGSTYARETW